MIIKLIGDLEQELCSLGLKPGDEVGAINFDVYKNGLTYHCFVTDTMRQLTRMNTTSKNQIKLKDGRIFSTGENFNVVPSIDRPDYGALCFPLSGGAAFKIPYSRLPKLFTDFQAQLVYKGRRQIETALIALQSGGFNIEDTHLPDMERINKLIALVFVAFAWACKAGIYMNKICRIRIKTYGRKTKNLF